MDKIVKLLKEECVFDPSDELVYEFLSHAEELEFEPYGKVIEIGSVNPDAYVIKTGVVYKSVINGGQEIIQSFGTPGSLFFSYYSYIHDLPSNIRFAACCKSTVLRIPREAIHKMLEENREFAVWMLNLQQAQLLAYDIAASIVQGDALSRYNRMLHMRPEIIKFVPLKLIASYLGITQQHLSRIRASIKKDS